MIDKDGTQETAPVMTCIRPLSVDLDIEVRKDTGQWHKFPTTSLLSGDSLELLDMVREKSPEDRGRVRVRLFVLATRKIVTIHATFYHEYPPQRIFPRMVGEGKSTTYRDDKGPVVKATVSAIGKPW